MANNFGTKYDFAGKTINKLLVKEYIGKSRWKCICLACGKETVKSSKDLANYRAYSCGCCNRNTDEDLTGQHFGRLLVQYRVKGKDGRTLWHCVCDCGSGKDINVRASDLLKGKAKSCGCLKHKNEAENLIGKTYNNLTVISREPNNKNNRSMWKCICKCGNIVIVSGKSLRLGNTKSCGCLKHEHHYNDLTGQVFGKLTVESLAKIENGITFWNCVCSCSQHTKKVIRYSDLLLGKTYSCGCSCVSHNGSRVENEIRDYIKSLGVCVTKENRILGRKEIDIFVSSNNIGIEYNGSKVHSSVGNPFVNKPKLYHQEKFLCAKEKGIHLISIFDVDWQNNREKIKMYLRSLFLPQKELMARKLEVRIVDNDIACEFVDKYHIQGANKAMMKINYGLYDGDNLLAVMSFGKLRLSKTEEGQYELHRYCVKDGYKIVGGANKLLKHFERDYSPKYLLSYSDNDYFLGSIYPRLGFTYSGQSRPRYYWYLNGEERKRESCMLKRLKVECPDLLEEAYKNEAPNKEDYVMLSRGACKVYRSGNTKWEKRYNT